MNLTMTCQANLRAGVTRCRTGDAEEVVAGNVRDGGNPAQVEVAHRLPASGLQPGFLVQVVITRWAVPGQREAVGGLLNAGHHGHSRHSARLYEAQMLNALCFAGPTGQKETRHRKNQNERPLDHRGTGRVHKLQMRLHWQSMFEGAGNRRWQPLNNRAATGWP